MDSKTNGKDQNTVKLKRQLGLFHAVCITIQLIIGGGIFITPKGVILATGSVGFALIIWLVSGFIATLGAICFAELGTAIPFSGGDYTYMTYMYGKFPGFLYLWMYVNVHRPCANSIKSLVFAEYVVRLLYFGDKCPSPHIIPLLAVIIVWLVCFLNIVNVKGSANIQTALSSLTITVLVIFSILGIRHVIQGHWEYIVPGSIFEGTITNPEHWVLALYSASYSYTGWGSLNVIVEEIKTPNVNIPRAIMLTMLTVTIVYMAVNFAYFAVLGPEVVKTSTAVGAVFAERTLGYYLSWIIPVAVAICTCGGLNSGILVGSRVAFVGGRSGHLPKLLGLINIHFSSPIISIIYQAILTTITCALLDVFYLIKLLTFILILTDTLIVVGMVYLKVKKPELKRPVNVPLFIPVIYIIFQLFLIAINLLTKPENILGGCIIILTGIPYYVLSQFDWDSHLSWLYSTKNLRNNYNKCVVTIQKALHCCNEDDSKSID